MLPVDVAEPDQVEAAAAAVEERFGHIDVWVNNAMATIFAPALDVTPEEFARATEVTYLGTVYGTMAALRRMVPRNQGAIVQVERPPPENRRRFRSDRHSPTARSLSSRPTAAASSRCAVSPTRCAPSFSIAAAACGSRWCSCQP